MTQKVRNGGSRLKSIRQAPKIRNKQTNKKIKPNKINKRQTFGDKVTKIVKTSNQASIPQSVMRLCHLVNVNQPK